MNLYHVTSLKNEHNDHGL